ncbi:MAG: hypothetical protein DYG83_18030 [Candidatus Brocadia sp. AMX2]|nr:hypothetical protein [Candidatus Brocadia sp. AMX2]MCQ3919240.1 hypothetical protein [Candidatus Brocadia sp.]NOG43122.1 hypothetical protein [Planctomycetota bacterium]GIK12355.1 MAG: hypothetical protein BroJett002_10620 [Candidatus Brocadia sinica]GJQ19627.1 MAG: hypothetical protein HBSIN01_35860 [Candidatus Brocadia sinica]
MRKICRLLLLSQATLLLPALIHVGANAAVPRLVEENKVEMQKQTHQLEAAKLRTMDQMLVDNAAKQPLQVKEMPFRPHGDPQKYEEMKKQAQDRAKAPQCRPPEAPLAPPGIKGINIAGVNQTTAGGWYPPDTHGAVGLYHFVEITNSHVDIYRKSNQVLEKSVSLNAFFGYWDEALFDPRCIFDHIWNRFIITAEAFPEIDGDQWHFIGISQTSNPKGAYWIYAINVAAIYGGAFWDYPQLGMDQDALIITANLFDPFYIGSALFTMSKARAYNGLGLGIPFWGGLLGTIAPPLVRDQDEWATLAVADPFTDNTGLYLYYLQNAENPAYTTLLGPYYVDVPDFFIPPSATQPGTAAVLDTLDCRFVNAGTQMGHQLYQVHTVDLGGLPTPVWYLIDWWMGTLTVADSFFAAGLSNDWNASIAANDFGDVFVTWTSNDPSTGTNAQVRLSGRRNFDPLNIGGGVAAFTSPTYYTSYRWGDYSAVTVDPIVVNQLRAWLVNETIINPTTWGSRIVRIGF